MSGVQLTPMSRCLPLGAYDPAAVLRQSGQVLLSVCTEGPLAVSARAAGEHPGPLLIGKALGISP
jgi:hypothetical protein